MSVRSPLPGSPFTNHGPCGIWMDEEEWQSGTDSSPGGLRSRGGLSACMASCGLPLPGLGQPLAPVPQGPMGGRLGGYLLAEQPSRAARGHTQVFSPGGAPASCSRTLSEAQYLKNSCTTDVWHAGPATALRTHWPVAAVQGGWDQQAVTWLAVPRAGLADAGTQERTSHWKGRGSGRCPSPELCGVGQEWAPAFGSSTSLCVTWARAPQTAGCIFVIGGTCWSEPQLRAALCPHSLLPIHRPRFLPARAPS